MNIRKMEVIANNCVSTISVPKDAKSGDRVAYNPILNLYVTMNYGEGISAWSPVSGKVTDITDLGPDGCLDMLMCPNNHIAMSYSEGNHGGVVWIYSLEKMCNENSTEPKPVLDIDSRLLPGHPGMIALSPDNSMLVSDAFDGRSELTDISIDWDRLEYKKRRLLQHNSQDDDAIIRLCCTPKYDLLEGLYDSSLIVGRLVEPTIDENNKQCQVIPEAKNKSEKDKDKKGCENDDDDENDDNNGDGNDDDDFITKDIKEIEDEAIDHCILDGIEYDLDDINDFIHDGENLIIKNADKILLLETCTNGSTAYLIASDLNPASNGLGINHKGQLMLCDGEDSIKIYEYKGKPRSLQALCRCSILQAIPCNYRENVEKLALPKTLTTYLLSKNLGY